MKIILTDNLNRDEVGDRLIATNVNEYWAARIVMLLNDKYSGDHSVVYFKAVVDDFKLKEDFVP